MKISISNDLTVLQSLVGLELFNQSHAAFSMEYVFKAAGLTVNQVKQLALRVMKEFGNRCVGAFPSDDKFIVVLKTNLRSVSSALKIKPEDYAEMKKAVELVLKKHPDAYKQYKQQGLTDMRYNWDILRASGYDTVGLYKYLNDSHINAALAKILANTGKGKT